MEKTKNDFLICEDKEQTWFIVSASGEEEAVRLARLKGFDPYFIVELSKAEKVSESERALKKYILKATDKTPSWVYDAEYKFVNKYGEEWYARIVGDGAVVEVTGSDVDWEVKSIALLPNYEPILEAVQKGVYPYAMHESERLWLRSILLVAIELHKTKT